MALDAAVRNAERSALLKALERASGNRSLAARLLGISRATLYNKFNELKLRESATGEADERPPNHSGSVTGTVR
jgi:DNA-binding NtrC family response regulator